MSIRTNANTKDRLREKGVALQVVSKPEAASPADPFKFWTNHSRKSCFVDLTIFVEGQQESRGTKWKGPFRGQPALISEMAPAIFEHFLPLAKKSVLQCINSLRAWWRLFDALGDEIRDGEGISSTADLNELHRQRALDQGMDRLTFGLFLLLANKTRARLGLKPLFWQRPEFRVKKRHLPPTWQTNQIRHELKHHWFSTLRRWKTADELIKNAAPIVSEANEPATFEKQKKLLDGYKRLAKFMETTGLGMPEKVDELFIGQSRADFYKRSRLTLTEILRGRYPDGDDVRVALLLCMANTGWNAAVLLSLDAKTSFLEPHPKDPNRYFLRGIKDRARKAEQLTEGLFKTRSGPGFVIRTLMTQTAPLRKQLQAELENCYQQTKTASTPESLQRKIVELEQGTRSVWLYATLHGISWLSDQNDGTALLRELIASINSRQLPDRQLSMITASDFRDAYAARVYNASGGSILAVMKALNHKRPSSTLAYLDNTLLQEQHRNLYTTFSAALWSEITVNRRVDPAILAMWSRHGQVSESNRQRLSDYRTLLRSRIGVGCKDPYNPPKHIAPEFQSDGHAMCSVQRCLLCVKHAVIFPSSLQGLTMRLAELRYLQQTLSYTAFTQSSFSEEMTNVELALLGFDSATTQAALTDWERRISCGTHRVIEFDGKEQ